jgi:hypothetical protein
MTDQEIEDHGATVDRELANQLANEQIETFAIEQRERELFHAAVQAMNGLVAAGSDRGPKGIAEHAFAIADALLAEREKRQKA